MKTHISIIILNKNAPELIIPQLRHLLAVADSLNFEIIVGDTGSTEPEVLDFYSKLGADSEKISLHKNLTYHFSKNNNALAEHAHGEWLVFLNNDVIFNDSKHVSNVITSLRRQLEHEKSVGAWGVLMTYANGGVQHAGISFLPLNQSGGGLPYHVYRNDPVAWTKLEPGLARGVPAVTGAFLAVRKKDFMRVGGFDEAYEKECQDVDLCLKLLRLGKKSFVLNAGPLVHLENGTRPKEDCSTADRELFRSRWQSFLQGSHLV